MTEMSTVSRVLLATSLSLALLSAVLPPLAAQAGDGRFSNPNRFMARDGEVLYRSSCQACHMAAAEGAAGAGAYPALARNTKLRTARYVTSVVVKGQKAMPGFGGQMDDEQVAAVVNYVRSHFGNSYADAVSAADVKTLR